MLAVASAVIGYAEGGRPARSLGSLQVICWALVISAPLVAIPTALAIDDRVLMAPVSAWAGVAYVSVISMILGFFAWYRGLAQGGIGTVHSALAILARRSGESAWH